MPLGSIDDAFILRALWRRFKAWLREVFAEISQLFERWAGAFAYVVAAGCGART